MPEITPINERLEELLRQIKGVSAEELRQFTVEASEVMRTFLEQHAASPNFALLAEHGTVQIGQKAALHFLRAERAAADAARTAAIGFFIELLTKLA
mgnify:CR=1 FL=1